MTNTGMNMTDKKRSLILTVILFLLAISSCQKEFNRTAWAKAETVRGEYKLVEMRPDGFPAEMDLDGDDVCSGFFKEMLGFERTQMAKGQIDIENTRDDAAPYRAGFNVDVPVQGIWQAGSDPIIQSSSGSIIPLNLSFYVNKDGSLRFEEFNGFGLGRDVEAQLAMKSINRATITETDKGFDVMVFNYPAYDYITGKIYYGNVTLSLGKK